MAVNALIAQGIRPIGADVPDVLMGLEQVRQGRQRNALAQQSLDANIQQDQSRNALYERQLGLTESAQQNALNKQNDERMRQWAAGAIEHARRDPNMIPMLVKEGKAQGFIPPEAPDTLAPEQVEQIALQLGIAPREQFAGSIDQQRADYENKLRLQQIQETGRQQRMGQQTRAEGQFVTLSPEEVAAAGLPPGTAAQRGPNGKIDVLSKRDNTSTLSQKDQNTARQKLNTVALARQQLNNIKQKFAGIQGSMSAGAFGQGRLPTEKGQMFDAAVNQMRSTLTALTRVPGVGAMSDYETKLDQAKFPDRKNYEAVTADQLEQLDGMLNAIETGYKDLIGAPAQAAPAGASGSWDQSQGPVRVNSPQEAMALPPGTVFVTPDGRRKVR